ncbi:MAG: hypothetical protein LUC87_00500 [Clostridiales bacterium]|nr:hypothetical protein [Clostridiales bacterium]
MKNFDAFKQSLNPELGGMVYAARQSAIKQADDQGLDPDAWRLYVQDGTAAILTVDILSRYHEWLHSDAE